MSYNEANTRKELIDRALVQAGWTLEDSNQVGIEIPVDGYNAEPWNGVTDYCLYQPNGEVIAVVEAKRQSRDPRVAQQQVRDYVTGIEKHQSFRPFAFMSNGDKTFFWDVGNEVKRQVAGFFSLRDLQNLLYIRQNKIPLQQLSVNLAIANRTYQQEAIGRVSERFDEGHRRALVVMATGTGKTRTIMALIEVFLRANQARTVLFVADRDALVRQALDDNFKVYLPNEPRDRIRTYNVDYSKRLYVGTLQTLIKCYKKFTPGFFDLVIFDESHRSIYNQFREVVEYFDARIIGLTATPADFIERNTFQVFRCSDGIPTFNYPYRDAVNEGYLVDYSLYQARTRFQREGIRGANLTEEDRNTLIEQGLDPDEIDYEGTELERTVSNKDTLRRQWEEIMEVCHKDESGQYPGKTIVFAVSQNHALRLASLFEEMYPQYPDMVQVITSEMERTDDLIDRFKKEEMPRIAISVDLLDTGVDVPEVVNLVFMKPVHSLIKMQQMIGRGTRSHEACRYLHRLPNGHKDEFLIIDFWENDFEKEPSEETVTQNLPVTVKIFNTRLKLLEHYLNDQQSAACQQVIADLRQQIGQIPRDAFSVQQVYSQVEEAWTDGFWRYLTQRNIDFLRTQVAPLLRFVAGVDVAEATFTNKVERLKLEILTDEAKPGTLESIAEDVSRLPDFVFEDSQRQDSANFCLSHRLRTATPQQLNRVIADLASQMKNRRQRPSSFVEIDLADRIATSGYITLGEGGEQVYVEEYRQRVEGKVLEIVENHPTIAAIRNGEAVTDLQLVALERTLRQELGGGNVQLSESNIRKAFNLKVNSLLAFLRELMEIEALPDYQEVVRRNFEEFIAQRQFNANQIRFLRAVQNVFLKNRRLEVADLYEEPLDRFGEDAVERWFTEEEVDELIEFTGQFAA
ncbi:DEAD/DEAH box helicase family protein [Desertifilum sp. FACHB-1129]|uniref:Type I restriction endonuclease n=1 Tax=Desertifilum tharense IPPAS B-1220 TaxID=1781255 RepID=A0A1E5QI76_9CYAN|nr:MULTISPECIES: DEAD/DEAH box helicase family protein [Desertifilum]MDA0212047.1 DEAD/DEAH box helicase family protein [Cyanobacteria bacterium FC1]MBD2314410.1 DEAD/DEAH box helicase family protein [Desertifilum sp. FACHB-1129]MBD2324895.1 DEAD/DEAH box helicase family protein [Desertifilum sp. FACHB-866]MBD2334988.1 DEAD/DEAH box helicase family protein [Desertifilum sp. FACHB-868]OEJ74321.1 type I restriction endonuclease [Desertifilum tharense IPPAS B-1220]